MFGEAKLQWRYSRMVIEINHQHVLSSTFYPATSSYNHFSKATQRTFTYYKSIIKALDKGEKFAQSYECWHQNGYSAIFIADFELILLFSKVFTADFGKTLVS